MLSNTTTMKLRALFAFTLLLLASVAFGQQESTYVITKNANVNNINSYTVALDGANLDQYRLLDKRRVLTFVSGVEVELLSANELTAKGITVNLQKLAPADTPVLHRSTFKVAPTGQLIEVQLANSKRAIHQKAKDN